MKKLKNIVVIFISVFIIAISIPKEEVQAATLPLKYNIDFARYNENTKSAEIQGWALSGNGIKSVVAVINGKSYTLSNTVRLDVYNAYPQYKNKNSGFSKSIPVTNRYYTKLEIRITEKNGKVTKISTSLNNLVKFKDKNLEKLVRSIIKEPTKVLYRTDVLKVTRLDLEYSNVTNLSGLENLTNLKYINLSACYVSDLSQLKGLTKLTELNLWLNNVKDITPIKGLINLQKLSMSQIHLKDISVIKNLTNLRYLCLAGNEIEDISAVGNLTKLETLILPGNKISDISPIENLINLQKLQLQDNIISDVSPLYGLSNLKELYIKDSNTQISNSDIQTLQYYLPECTIK